MRLNLMQGIPVGQPLPADLPPIGGAILHVDGVAYLEQSNTIFVGFKDAAAVNEASVATGWNQFDESTPILDAGRPDPRSNGRLVFVVKGIAYHSWRLDVEPLAAAPSPHSI